MKQKKVLVVENCPVQSESIRMVLEAAGYWALIVRSAEDAIAILRMHDPEVDVVVTDLVLPKKSGFDLLQWSILHRPDLPVVITTAHTSESNCRKAFRLGVSGYSPKSELLTGFIQELEQAITWHHSKTKSSEKLLSHLAKEEEG